VPESGLSLGDKGFVRVGDTLQSPSHPEVFVSGELGVRSDGWRAPCGTVLFGKAPALGLNLRRFLAGGELVSHRDPPRSMALLDTGQGHALAGCGRVTMGGRWVGRLKERAERQRVLRMQVAGAKGGVAAAEGKKMDETVV